MHGNAAKGAPHPINYQGFIADNSIQLWNKIPTSEDAISSLGEQLGLIHTATNQKLSLKYSEMSVEDFKKLMDNESTAIDDLFTRNEGFLQRESHLSLGPVTLAQPGIYQHILEAIDQAKETAFVDIFWMGGSIGVQLAKALMKKTLANPQFKVYIITDTVNRFNYGTQLDTVYRYIRAFSEKFPQRSFYIVPASLDLKRTALPEFVDLLFTNSTVNLSQKNVALDPLFADHRFNLIGKSDHSKVVVIDGKNPNDGKAFVGSKNWTDASGGIATDEVAEIQGPAVAAILNHYYYDVIEGFLLESRKGNYILDHFAAQFPQEKSKSKYQAIQYLIAGIDVLNRYESDNIFVKQIPYVEKGSDTIALGQNNIYGTETSAVDQNIHAILQAKEQIIIDDQFLYDPFIASALKTAITKHNVKVYLMLESLTAVGDDSKLMAHVPNNLFLPELIALGAKAKWKEVPKDMANTILATKEKYGHLLAPEFHLKSITVDGVRENEYALCQQDQPSLRHHDTVPALITGSANKDVMTMTGGFREYQVLLYSESAVLRHDCIFWSRWQSAHETIATDGLDFELPPEAKNIDVGQEDFLNILRMVFFSTYNFTKDYF